MTREFQLPGAWPTLVDEVVQAARGRRLVVLLDGGSGAGKTTLARRLHRDLEARLGTIQLVSLDDVYPGWHGLAAASELVWQSILRPASPGYPGWDWARDQPSGWRGLDPQLPIIVEGCGAISHRSAALANVRIWYEMDAGLRQERALGRDGDGYRPWWDTWAAQEAAHWQANQPWELADLIVRGAA